MPDFELTPEQKRARYAERFKERQERIDRYRSVVQRRVRSLDQLGRRVLWADSTGRIWGIRIFTLAEHDFFMALTMEAILKDDSFLWAGWAREQLCSPRSIPSLILRIRRFLGMYDYSCRTVFKLCKRDITKLRDAVFFANYGKGFADWYFELKKAEEEAASKADDAIISSAGWGDTMASMFINKGIMPKEFMEFTLPQLDAISEYNAEQQRKDKFKNRGSVSDIESAGRRRW